MLKAKKPNSKTTIIFNKIIQRNKNSTFLYQFQTNEDGRN
jgi:hypothetical protein